MCVSENRGTPKSSILIGISIINHPFWGKTPYFWKHPFVTRKHYVISLWLMCFSWEHRYPVAGSSRSLPTHHGTTLRLCGVELLRDAQTLGTLPRTEGGLGGVRRRLVWKLGKLNKKNNKNGRNQGIFFWGGA